MVLRQTGVDWMLCSVPDEAGISALPMNTRIHEWGLIFSATAVSTPTALTRATTFETISSDTCTNTARITRLPHDANETISSPRLPIIYATVS